MCPGKHAYPLSLHKLSSHISYRIILYRCVCHFLLGGALAGDVIFQQRSEKKRKKQPTYFLSGWMGGSSVKLRPFSLLLSRSQILSCMQIHAARLLNNQTRFSLEGPDQTEPHNWWDSSLTLTSRVLFHLLRRHSAQLGCLASAWQLYALVRLFPRLASTSWNSTVSLAQYNIYGADCTTAARAFIICFFLSFFLCRRVPLVFTDSPVEGSRGRHCLPLI